MGRVAKKAPETAKVEDESPIQTITQTRAKRTPKPNPKYSNESIIATPKIESSESNGSTDIELKLPESKIVKATTSKKINASEAKVAAASKSLTASAPPTASVSVKGRGGAIKKQKIDFDDDEKTKDADEIPLPSPPSQTRTTRSGKNTEVKDEVKIGNDSVAIVDVASIITSSQDSEVKEEPVKNTRGAGRKRLAADVVNVEETSKEDSPKKKKEEEKVSLITTRKSYMPATPVNKKVIGVVEKKNEIVVNAAKKKEEIDAEKVITNTSVKTRRAAMSPQSPVLIDSSPEKKAKIEIIKSSPVVAKTIPEPRKLPVANQQVRKEIVAKVISPNPAPGVVTKANNSVKTIANAANPAIRILNTMATPKGAKESPNIKLAGDGSDRKVFSIEMSDGSVVEKKTIAASPLKSPSAAVKENIATINKPQASVLLKNKLESELNRMKASANAIKGRNLTPGSVRQTPQASNVLNHAGKRITKFESWYVIDVKNQDVIPSYRHSHSFSLMRLGNNIKDVQLPSEKWEYKITLQKRAVQKSGGNNNNDEIYTGEITESSIGTDRQNLEPICILFKRSHKDNNRTMIDRSLMIKNNMFAITMNGKQCHLIGAPNDIKSLEDIQILLQIIDSSSPAHSCVEPSC